MGQQLRLTFAGRDHHFQILNKDPLSNQTDQISILLDGTEQTLVRENGKWVPGKNSETLTAALTEAIGKAIALRFRI